MIEAAVAFPEIQESDDIRRRSAVGREIGAWCQGRVPGHVTANGFLGTMPAKGDWDSGGLTVWLDDGQGLPGGEEFSCTGFVLSYRELCSARSPAELVATRLKGALAELALYQYEETKRRLAQAKGGGA